MSILRTAARVGVASSVHGRVQRRQQQRFAMQDQQAAALAQAQAQAQAPVAAPPPPPAAAPAPDMNESLAQLKQLGELRDAGILTDAEFEAKKTQILGG